MKLCTKVAGKGAERDAASKRNLYVELMNRNSYFIPFVVETNGPSYTEGINLINRLGKMIALKNSELQSTFFLKQRINLAIKGGNASLIIGTMGDSERSDEEKAFLYVAFMLQEFTRMHVEASDELFTKSKMSNTRISIYDMGHQDSKLTY